MSAIAQIPAAAENAVEYVLSFRDTLYLKIPICMPIHGAVYTVLLMHMTQV